MEKNAKLMTILSMNSVSTSCNILLFFFWIVFFFKSNAGYHPIVIFSLFFSYSVVKGLTRGTIDVVDIIVQLRHLYKWIDEFHLIKIFYCVLYVLFVCIW